MVRWRGGPPGKHEGFHRELNAFSNELIRRLQAQRRKDVDAAKRIATHSLERGQHEFRIDLRLPGEFLCKHRRRHRGVT